MIATTRAWAGAGLAAVALAGAAAARTSLPPPTGAALSQEARAQLQQMQAITAVAVKAKPGVAESRDFAGKAQAMISAAQRKTYAVTTEDGVLGGVPVRIVSLTGGATPGYVLLNLHGGGFEVDSGSLTETIPIAALTGLKVVAVLYRLAPEHPFPAQVDDTLVVYRELLKSYPADHIVLFGTSAGAILGPEVVVALQRAGLPQPAALGVFSGAGDLKQLGDSATLFDPKSTGLDLDQMVGGYLGSRDPSSPEVSPLHGSLAGFPPTYCVTSTRDFLLSSTVNFCRALDEQGVRTRLSVYDGLPHAFWTYIDAPESTEALRNMARFLCSELKTPTAQCRTLRVPLG